MSLTNPQRIINSIPQISMNIYISRTTENSIASNLHIHNEIELMYVVEGRIKWGFEDSEITVNQGECIFVNSRIPHSTYAVNDSSYLLIQFNKENILPSFFNSNYDLFKFFGGTENSFYFCNSKDEISHDLLHEIKEIYKEFNSKQKLSEVFIYASSVKIMGILMRNNIISSHSELEVENNKIKKIAPIVNYIRLNYTENITLNDLSKFTSFNPNYLCRLFKHATNKTITEYINFVRIEKCVDMLLSSRMNISQIAYACGFSNISHFNITFRNQYGCSPTEYKKKIIIKKTALNY